MLRGREVPGVKRHHALVGGVRGDEAALGCADTPSLPSFPAFRPSYSVAPSRKYTGTAGAPGPPGDFSPGPGGWQRRREQGDPGSAAGTAREQRGSRRRGSSGHAGGWWGAGGTGGRRKMRAYPAGQQPSLSAFDFISFISLHSTRLLCRVLPRCPRGGCPCCPSALAPGPGEVELRERQGSG